jgi:DNA-directed RNA polymerase specialized sigma24 family protein
VEWLHVQEHEKGKNMSPTENEATTPSGLPKLGKQAKGHQALGRTAANDPFFSAAVNAAKTRAFRAAVTAGLSSSERDDLIQDILFDIYRRKDQYDPTRGAPGTFTGLVSTHTTADFLNARKADRQKMVFAESEDIDTTAVVAMDRAIHGFTMSLPAANDDSMEGHDAPRAEGMSSCWDDDSDLFSDSNAHHDVVTALAYMSDEQRGLFDLLAAHQDVPAAAKASGMSSATFYRRVDDLRMHLRMFGIRPAA